MVVFSPYVQDLATITTGHAVEPCEIALTFRVPYLFKFNVFTIFLQHLQKRKLDAGPGSMRG